MAILYRTLTQKSPDFWSRVRYEQRGKSSGALTCYLLFELINLLSFEKARFHLSILEGSPNQPLATVI